MQKANNVLSVRLSLKEKRYALALSKRVAGCKRTLVGSMAHGLKWCLHEQARREKLKIFED
jgi:hypothetical protein